MTLKLIGLKILSYMYQLRVWFIVYELCSYCLHAGLVMSNYKLSRQLENIVSDKGFIEECVRQKFVPKGLQWNLRVNGLDREAEEKVERSRRMQRRGC